MTREMLFRGKRLNNGEWLYGLYDDEEHSADFPAIIPNCSEQGKYADWAVAPATVGQYTGLTDKNGKKIWDGDILKTKYGRLCKVVWFSSEQYCGWDFIPINDKHSSPDKWDLFYHRNLDVIGNIHDNPELLE